MSSSQGRAALGILVAAIVGQGADLKCGGCHVKEAQAQQHSKMAYALATPATDPLFTKHSLLRVRKGAFTYAIETKNSNTTYSVSDGVSTITVPLSWVFGVGTQTYVFSYQGRWYEGLVSYYPQLDGLDTTIGDDGLRPATLTEALGRPIAEKERSACFACHSSGSETAIARDTGNLRPGITCDHCHSGALEHQTAALKGSRAFQPVDLRKQTADQISTFCGQCHRTWETVMRMPLRGPNDVRFQPYRLENSKCYNGADNRIKCTACHNVHAASLPAPEVVTAQCLTCHATSQSLATGSSTATFKACPVSTSGCASCHMPKVELPSSHKLFTDHQIRVVRAGEQYPD